MRNVLLAILLLLFAASFAVSAEVGSPRDSGGTPEGTAVLSTGETGGTKFLREDGDGTSSWQPAAGRLPEEILDNL